MIASTETAAAEPDTAYDLDRLERAVSALIDLTERARAENQRLRAELAARGQRIQTLESDLRHANQRRQDAIKRVDDLIAQIEQLDAELGRAEK